jgi:FtsP/CotA-like multicopper oxidase with cupredoxin domain
MLSRRGFIKLGTVAGAASLVPIAANQAALGSGHAATAGANPAHLHGALAGQGAVTGAARAVAPYSVQMPVPPTLRPLFRSRLADFYLLDTKDGQEEILPGTRTAITGYGGSYIGPTIRAKSGRRVVVVHRNQTAMPTAAHLHGGHVPANSDGHPLDVINPGACKTYEYPNRQPGATLWYHDHAHHMESEHVYRGMHAFYLLEGEDEANLRLPSGEFDVPIMLTDARFADDASLVYESDDFRNRNTILVNGRPQPFFQVAARKYRLRLANASNLRIFQLSLAAGGELTQIATDGGLLPAPVRTGSVDLAPGERVEVVIDFAKYPIGTQLVLSDTLAGPILRFDVTRAAVDHSRVPDVLRPLPPLPAATTTRQFSMGLDPATFQFVINGKGFDPTRVDTTIKRGTTEIWEVTNLDTAFGIPHDFHLHLVQFRVLDRDGVPPPAGEAGLKDTVLIGPGQTVRLQATFADFTGRYMYHCHMIDHSSTGMMAQMEIVP